MAQRVFVSIYRFFAVTFLSFLLISCGVGDGPNKVFDSLPPAAKQTGFLLDSAVSGVTFRTATQTGVTNALGEFQYVDGEMVTFSVGGIVLGIARGSAILTPVELTASVNPTNQAALNLLVFLQSIDEDGDHTNGITISSAAQNAAANMSLDFEATDFATRISSIVSQITGGANTVVSEAVALQNFYNTYVQFGGTDSVSFLFPGFDPVGGGGGGSFDGGLVSNADFNNGATGWSGNAANVIDDGGNNVNFANVTAAGNPFDVNLSHVLTLTPGESYTLEFKAKSNGVRTMLAGIGLNHAPFDNLTETANLTTVWQTFSFNFSAIAFGDSDSRVIFDMGADTGEVYIDDVSLVVSGGSGASFDGGLVSNADFNNGATGWSGNAANVIDDGGNNVNFANVTAAGNPFDVNLSHVLTLTPGESYTLEFKAKSNGVRTMLAGIGLNHAPFDNLTETANLTTVWQTFSFNFSAIAFGDSDSRVIFDMGADTGEVYIDDVSLVVSGGSGASFDGGLVSNADFNNGATGWSGNAANVIDDGGNNVNFANVTAAGNPFDVNLSHVLTLTPGESYTLEFKAKSNGVRTMLAGIGLNHAPFDNLTETANLTTVWQTFSFNFSAIAFGDSDSRVIFDMGADTGEVYIDDVSLVVSGGSGASFDGGLVSNADFNNGATGWSGNAANVIDDGGNNVNFANVTAAGNPFDVNLSHVLTLTPGESYTLEFKAKSNGVRTMLAGIGLNHAPFDNLTETANLTTVWQTFSFNFSAIAFGDSDSRVIFDMGADTGEVYIDDVSLVVSGGSGAQLAVNGDFEAGDLSSWTTADNGGAITADNTQDSGSTWSVHVVAGPGNNPSISLAGLAVGTVMSGDTIDVSFDMCGSAASGGVIFPALLSEFGGGMGADRVNLATIAAPPSVWTRFNYSATAGSNVAGGVSLQLDVVCGADAGCAADVYFDNVSVTIGGGPVAGSASGNSCVGGGGGVTLPVDFEDAGGPYVFADFNGGQASVVANPQSNGINVSAKVGQMLKFADATFGGSTFDLGGALTVPANSLITMKVWSPRIVPVLFKLEGGPAAEVEVTHGGTGWEELTFDFTGITTGDHTGITFIFDNGTNGEAATDPGNWTFYFDDINFGVVDPVVVGDGNELLTNGDFEADFTSWGTPPGAVVTNKFYQVTANDGGNVFDTNLSQVVTLTAGEDYVLTFRAKASVDRNMVAGVGDSGPPFGADTVNVPLTTEWQAFSYPITATAIVGGADSRVLFDMGTVASMVNIDDVGLVLASAPGVELLTNGDFEADFASWGTPPGAVVTNKFYQVTANDGGNVFDTNLSQVVTLTAGEDYVLTFRAKASVDRNMVAGVGDSGPPFGADIVDVPLTTEWQAFSYPITATAIVGGADSRVLFDMGTVASMVNIDDVSLQVVDSGSGGGGELAINGDFEVGDISGWQDFSSANNGTFTATMAEASPTLGGSWSGNLVASVPGGGGPASFPVVKQPNVGVGTVTANSAMTVSFDLKGSLTGGGGVIFVEFFSELSGGGTSAAAIIAQPVPTGSWVHYDLPVTTGSDVSGGVTLQLKADCGANPGCTVDAYFDNVSITID